MEQGFDSFEEVFDVRAEDEDVVDEFSNIWETCDDDVTAAVPFVRRG